MPRTVAVSRVGRAIAVACGVSALGVLALAGPVKATSVRTAVRLDAYCPAYPLLAVAQDAPFQFSGDPAGSSLAMAERTNHGAALRDSRSGDREHAERDHEQGDHEHVERDHKHGKHHRGDNEHEGGDHGDGSH